MSFPPTEPSHQGEDRPAGVSTTADAPEDLAGLADRILDIVFQHRRLLPQAQLQPVKHEQERAIHYPKLFHAFHAAAPVSFILPAFPAKSANPNKTLGVVPDLGEWLSLQRLQRLCLQIGGQYPHGARCVICSDGRVFSDLVGVTEENVTLYHEALRTYIAQNGLNRLSMFDLDDVFKDLDYAQMREELLIGFAEPVRALRERTRNCENAKALFNGIHRFVFEDLLALLERTHSRNSIRRRARAVAYRVIQRSNAWSRLLAERFPHALRLSIHPQPRVSEKIGIHLLDAKDPWGTPWHNVVLEDATGYRLVSRSEAEARDPVLIFKDGRPSHYAAPGARNQEMRSGASYELRVTEQTQGDGNHDA